MKKLLPLLLMALALLAACGQSLERKGDNFLKQAENADSEARRQILEKNAFDSYRQALQNAGEDASPELVNKFVYATIIRLNNLKGSAGITHNIMTPLRGMVDDRIDADYIESRLRDKYALFLVEYADTLNERNNLSKSFIHLNRAMDIAADQNIVQSRYDELKGGYIDIQLEKAKKYFAEATEESEPNIETLLKADYAVQVVLQLDEENETARDMDAQITPMMLDTYRAYQRVYPHPVRAGLDTTIYRAIENEPIFIAIKEQNRRGNTLTLEGLIFHSEAGFKLARLQDRFFTLHLEDGETLSPSDSEFSSRTLEIQSEEEFSLTFNGVTADPVKLTYACEEDLAKSTKRLK
ncbi:hypothetical protein [Chitinivibrio alkaliphilus]|uniref:Lipoprotein n=1 Tax=Chitinivibrio alkaliphilus ACht1 TaxID=1313304 RepID=U7D5M5_9BACT|nr:hypothetical protein [Chitinivibrio alkaliphilus]ERP30841.1 hypothetical protein CALK_2292 [Chitinivibrio alkaliphilus ACht1]